ncbi:MAG TPA: DUF1707 domain-containing protein [Streptosporangiaceae bacterium]|nr:DUF1707 domain-containing protein [Streptosporangiaceae bacterium]
MTTERHDEPTLKGRGHLRAAHVDRERVVAVLKAAFVQGRLDKDELDARVGQALAARTYADLAALTADLPAGIADIPPGLVATGTAAAEPARAPAGTAARAAFARAGVFLLLTVALVEGAFLTGSGGFLLLAIYAFTASSACFGYGAVQARHQRRARRSLPPAVPGPA